MSLTTLLLSIARTPYGGNYFLYGVIHVSSNKITIDFSIDKQIDISFNHTKSSKNI